MAKGKRTGLKVLKVILLIILILVLAFVAFLAVGAIKEWKPADREKAEMYTAKEKDRTKKDVETGKEYSLLSYNIGYAGLGEEADYFLDGGSDVIAKDKATVENNLKNIEAQIVRENADFTCIQEVDRDSKRSYFIDEKNYLDEKLNMDSAYADNFKTFYIPYPLKQTTGKVRAGLYTASKYNLESGERISLPVPFKWPIRMFNLKRCLLVNRVPVAGTDKELIIVNLHLEAYDDGEGKAAQTKALTSFVEAEYRKGNYVIATGDWNQAFYVDNDMFKMPEGDLWKPTEIKLDDKYSDWQLVYDTKVPSCRLDNKPYKKGSKDTYYYLIDGALISPNVKVKSVNTLDEGFKYSDHNPVKIMFELEK